MASEGTTNELSLEASADLSASQFRAVIVDVNGRAAIAGVNSHIVGVLQDKPTQLGAAAHVKIGGVTKARAGAAIVANARVAVDANGDFITAVALGIPAGVALGPAGAAGELFTMVVTPGGAVF